MTRKKLPAAATQSFASLEQDNEHGAEYWSMRDVGQQPGKPFRRRRKMVEFGFRSQRQAEGYHLSRFACYLIARNTEEFKALSGAAQDAGVQRKVFSVFTMPATKVSTAGWVVTPSSASAAPCLTTSRWPSTSKRRRSA